MNDTLEIQNLIPEEVFSVLGGRSDGLTNSEVQERLLQVGKNTFEVRDRWKWIRSLIKQLTNFFTILLNVSAAICFVAHHIQPGESMNVLGWALLGVSLLNAMFSFFQEYRAEKAMEALKKFLPPQVIVRRQSQAVKILAEEIVPGDLLIIAEGDRIPADARLIKCDELVVNNAPLTGEAKPLALTADPSAKRLAESDNVAFAGCSVIKGSGEAVVFATGLRTEFGKIAHLSQAIKRSPSPLERETGHMVRVLTMIATLMGFSFFLYGVLTGRPLWVNLVFMMGIIVANVPEGLLPTFTLSLAMGSLRMARKNVLVKALNAVEALGAVHVICTDKTGTLTLNQLTITRLADPLTGRKMQKDNESLFLRLALCASEARRSERGFSGDPLDVAVAKIYTENGDDFETVAQNTVKHFAFDVEKRRSAGVYHTPEEGFFAVKGAWEVIRPLVSHIYSETGGSAVAADEERLNRAEAVMHKMASSGLRVIAVAHRLLKSGVPAEIQQDELEKDLILNGFLGIEDPIRNEVPEAVKNSFGAGIDVILITGDHPDTALAVGRKSGIVAKDKPEHAVLTGDVLETMTQAELIGKLEQGVRIFARSTPEQKMKIVSALKTMEKLRGHDRRRCKRRPGTQERRCGHRYGQGRHRRGPGIGPDHLTRRQFRFHSGRHRRRPDGVQQHQEVHQLRSGQQRPGNPALPVIRAAARAFGPDSHSNSFHRLGHRHHSLDGARSGAYRCRRNAKPATRSEQGVVDPAADHSQLPVFRTAGRALVAVAVFLCAG